MFIVLLYLIIRYFMQLKTSKSTIWQDLFVLSIELRISWMSDLLFDFISNTNPHNKYEHIQYNYLFDFFKFHILFTKNLTQNTLHQILTIFFCFQTLFFKLITKLHHFINFFYYFFLFFKWWNWKYQII